MNLSGNLINVLSKKWPRAAITAFVLVLSLPVMYFASHVAAATINIFPSTTPAVATSDDGSGVELGVKFTSDTAGQVTGIRFYKGDTTNGGTHYGHLWSSTGTQLAQAQFTSETASGWQSVTFASPVTISANTTYIASYYTPTGHYSYTSQGLNTAVNNPPLHTLASTASQNGVYRYTGTATGGFPTDSYNATNYFVDVNFSTSSDTTAPNVSVTNPTNNQSVSGTVALAANASDNVSVTSVQYYLDGAALGSAITTSPYAFNWNTTSVANGSHTLVAKALDSSGNIGTSATITVNVQNAVAANSSIWTTATVPTHADSNDTSAVTLGVKFQSSSAGYITGIRFYKGSSGNGGTHVGQLWSSNGTLLAQATFTNESSSGWQNVAFSTGVQIAANTTYVASYFAPQGHYAYDAGAEPGGLTNAVTRSPLTALASGANGGNGVYIYGGNASFPSQSYNDTNYWADVFFSTTNTAPDTTAPSVSVTSPASGATVTDKVSLTAKATDNTAVTSVQYYLDGAALGSALTASPYTFSWDTNTASNGSHVLSVKASDANGNVGTSANVAITVQNAGQARPGVRGSGPILVLTDPTNTFSDDYCNALFKTEGLPECAATDAGNLTASFSLSSYRVIVLANTTPLSTTQVSQLSSWVTAGGTLIAMRPNDNLDSLLGITESAGTLSDRYYKVDPAQLPGIQTETMQFHGTADQHSLAGAQAMGMLYSAAGTATSNPAITTRTVGSGKAIAYMFDVSKSVMLTRNGNPALAGQNTVSTDGQARFTDRFGNGYLDVSKTAIPQADELQRSLANIAVTASSAPRLWYFPAYNSGTIKAALIMTGDDHSTNSQTLNRFAAEKAASPAGCSVANWTCYTSTSYAYAGAFSDTAAKPYTDAGFEVAMHASDSGSCISNWATAAQFDNYYSQNMEAWKSAFPSISAAYPMTTERLHCYGIWKDYASIPTVEAAHGIKSDNNSSCWPNQFLNVSQCFFSGSGIPENYVDATGKLTGVYQFNTHATDENPSTVTQAAINGLVTEAKGANEDFGYFTLLCHLDNLAISNQCATDALSVASTNNIPMISARLASQFWDGRNNTNITATTYSASRMTFTVNPAVNNMQVMIPVKYNAKTLSSITRAGTTVSSTTQTINGIQYAFVTLPSGSQNLVANYR